jgi:hypothetical protein
MPLQSTFVQSGDGDKSQTIQSSDRSPHF